MDAKGTPGDETEAYLNDLVLAWKSMGIRTLGTRRVVSEVSVGWGPFRMPLISPEGVDRAAL